MNIQNEIANLRVHFFDDDENLVYSIGKKVYLVIDGKKKKFDFSSKFDNLISSSKLLSRLFRINRLNVVRISKFEYLVINNGKLYMINNSIINFKFNFPFTKYVHNNTISVHNDNIVVGEYGNSNSKFDVGIYKSDNKGITWRRISLFKKGVVKQILAIYFDPYTKNYWVFTGDKINEIKIAIYSKDFVFIKFIGEKNLIFRAISVFFFKNHVLWYMNNPFGDSYVIKYNRINGTVEKCQKLPGPAWYSIYLGNKYYLSIASESSYKSNDIFLLSSSDGESWNIEKIFKKDIFPKFLFLYGLITFAEVKKNDKTLVCFVEAVKKKDSKTLFLDVKNN